VGESILIDIETHCFWFRWQAVSEPTILRFLLKILKILIEDIKFLHSVPSEDPD
jgi:hypothetical protein